MGSCNSTQANAMGTKPEDAMGRIARGWEVMVQMQSEPIQPTSTGGNWEINKDTIDTNHHINLGEGNFGICYETRIYGLGVPEEERATSPEQHMLTSVVIKRLSSDVSKSVRAAFMRELEYMKDIKHANIMKLHGAVTKEDPVLLVLEQFTFGNLKQFLQTQRTAQQLTAASMFSFARNVASGLDYLHSRGVVHADVATRNCQVTEDLVVKIADYGLSTTLFAGEYLQTKKHGYLPVRWLAPELFPDQSNNLPQPTIAGDVWAFGVLTLEIFTWGALPFSMLSNKQVQEHVQAGNTAKVPEELATTHNLRTLVESCFTRASTARPTTNSIISELDARIADAGGFGNDDRRDSMTSTLSDNALANSYVMIGSSQPMTHLKAPEPLIDQPEEDEGPSYEDVVDVTIVPAPPANEPSVETEVKVHEPESPQETQAEPEPVLEVKQQAETSDNATDPAESPLSPMDVDPNYTEDAFNHPEVAAPVTEPSAETAPAVSVEDDGAYEPVGDANVPQDLYAQADTHDIPSDVPVVPEPDTYAETDSHADVAGAAAPELDNYAEPQDTLKRGTQLKVQAEAAAQAPSTANTSYLPMETQADPRANMKKKQSFRTLTTFKQASNPELALEEATGRSLVLELDLTSIELGKPLGKGAFGEVRLGTITTQSGRQLPCACKTLKPGALDDDEDALLAEAQLVSRFRHDNVVSFFGQVTKSEPRMIVFELMENGSLFGWLATNGEAASLSVKLKMGIDIAKGMAYLSEQGYVHRDLATRNVLVGSDLECKISDFGLSRDLEDEMYYESDGGMVPVRWTPPEAFKFRKFSTKSDVWSYGITLYEIFTNGELPYGKQWSNLNVMVEVERGYRLKAPKGCPRAIYKLMMASWIPHRRGRPSFEQLVDQMELAYDMLFPADDTDQPMQVDYECQDLTTVFVGVPVPDEAHLDDHSGDEYLKPGAPLQLPSRNDDLFAYSADGTTAILKSSMQVERQDSFAGVVSDPQAKGFKREGSFRKQQQLGTEEGVKGATVDYNSNRAVKDVIKIAMQRETVSKLEEEGISRAMKAGVNEPIQRPAYIENVGRATEVKAARGIKGRKNCKCRRFKCVCDFSEETATS